MADGGTLCEKDFEVDAAAAATAALRTGPILCWKVQSGIVPAPDGYDMVAGDAGLSDCR